MLRKHACFLKHFSSRRISGPYVTLCDSDASTYPFPP